MIINKLGYYSNSQNGLIVSVNGIAPCIRSGGNGHDTNMPKILVRYESRTCVLRGRSNSGMLLHTTRGLKLEGI